MTDGHFIGGFTISFNPYLREDQVVMMWCGASARDYQSARNVID